MRAVWGATPKVRGQLFGGQGNRMGTAYETSLTRMEEGRRDGVERIRSARWIGRKSHASGITFPHTHAKVKKHTCGVEIANRSDS